LTAKDYYSKAKEICKINADSDRAKSMEKYMRNKFNYYGFNAPRRKELVRELIKDYGYPSKELMPEFIQLCWADEYRELQYMAMDILARRLKYIDESYASLFEEMITNKSWWDTVDWIAARGVGPLFMNYPVVKSEYYSKWFKSDNMWLNRTVILSQLGYKEKTDKDLLFEAIDHFKGDTDFFIRKACGWALREYSKTNPDKVRQFMDTTEGLSPLTIREGRKYL
jgi:3-methyladenine DNA glycosylase AlkD